MKKIKSIIIAMALTYSCVTNTVHASSSFACSGTISILGVHGTDRVMLKLSGMNTVIQICHLSNTIGTDYPISAEQCKLAYTTLLTAYSMKQTMNVHFDNIETGTSCSNFKAWEIATARWVHLDG